MGESWRVVLASGEVREVVARWPVARHGIPRWGAQHREDEHTGHGSTARGAVVDCAAIYLWEVVEILAPGEMTCADLAAQLAAVTAERDALRADHRKMMNTYDIVTNRAGFLRHIIDHAYRVLDAREGETTIEAAQRVTRELAVLRAQLPPLLACVDALRSAATAAGWRDADATGETLVAWVRRGEREACAARCDAVAKGADNALPGREGDQRAYLKGRRRGAEVCAEALREGGE